LPVDRNAVPRPVLPPFPAPPATGAAPPAVGREGVAPKTPPLGLSLDLPRPAIPEPPSQGESLTPGDPLADAHAPGSLDLDLPPAVPARPPLKAPPPKGPPPVPKAASRTETKALDFGQPPAPTKPPTLTFEPPPTPTVPGIDSTLPSFHAVSGPQAPHLAPPSEVNPTPSRKPFLAPLVPEPTEPPPGEEAPGAAPGMGPPLQPAAGKPAPGAPGENVDLGFSLEFESSPRTSSGASPVAIPFPSARVASEGMAEAAAEKMDEVPHLAPPSGRPLSAARALRPQARRSRVPRWAFFAGGTAILVAAAAAVVLPLLTAAPNPDNVIKPFLPELARDNPVAYQKAAAALNAIAANYKDAGVRLRLKAAELLLTSAVAHGGDPNDATVGAQAAASAASETKLAPLTGRVRALVAIANGKPGDADKLLTDRAAPESQLITGMARLAEEKLPAAVTPLRSYVAARPDDLLGHYLLARALGTGAEARKELELVLAKNPAHAGAQIALTRLEETPAKRLEKASALADKKLVGAGSTELAILQLVIGQAQRALGHPQEAMDAYQKAIALDKRITAAFLALGEQLLYQGKYPQALERLKAAGPALEASPAGKFALGGATLATGNAQGGLALVTAGAKALPDDPRGPFWTGVAATMKQPPDFAAGEQGFRDALKKDPKFLPASLKLAAILQQQDKAQESLSVLRTAEEAGAPPSLLQLAWGEALIIAGEPAKAQEVFEKAIETDPKSVPALLGIASALEAQGKIEEAKVSLERTLKSFPESLGLRERLAQVQLKLGQKAEALALLQAEIQAGHPTIPIRLEVARLALDLGKIELAQSEVKKVFDQSPRNAEAAYYMARIFELRNSDGNALTEYRHATTWGNTPQFSLDYGKLLDKLGKQHEALASLANAISLPEGRMARGRIFFRTGEIDSALEDFQAAAKMKPEDAEPVILQALCFDNLGQSKKADETWRAALKIDPDEPEPHYRLGRTDMDSAKLPSAIEHFRKAMAKAPEKAPYLPDLLFQLAQAELLSGSKAAALANFKKYLEIAPPSAPSRPEAEHQLSRLGGDKSGRILFDNEKLSPGRRR
jgi:tetratricopeptide (TPR) repeat protein